MAAPNYPRNGIERSRPNHRKRTNGGVDLRFGPMPIRWIIIIKMDSKIGFEMSCRGNTWMMCEYHDSNRSSFGDIWCTDKLIHFSSTVEPLLYDHTQNHIGVVV